jgi:hypothetical protein
MDIPTVMDLKYLVLSYNLRICYTNRVFFSKLKKRGERGLGINFNPQTQTIKAKTINYLGERF